MKKSLIAAVLLFVLSAAGLITAGAQVARTQDDVHLTETVLAGDPSETDDLTAVLHAECEQKLSWDTTMTSGRKTETDFAFRPRGLEWNRSGGRELNSYIEFYTWRTGLQSNEDIKLPEPLFGPLNKILTDVADSFPAGQESSRRVRVAEYFEYFPLFANFWLSGINEIHYDDGRNFDRLSDQGKEVFQFAEDLGAAFRFPVPEDYELLITMDKDADGKIYDINLDLPEDGACGDAFWCSTADSEDYIYFVVSASFTHRMSDGEYTNQSMDYSHTPNGFGIYRLPRVERPLTMEDLEFVMPLDEENQEVEIFCPDQEYERLFLILREKGTRRLLVLSPEDGSVLQEFPLWTPKKDEWVGFLMEDDFVLLQNGENEFKLYSQEESGDYQHCFDGRIPTDLFPGDPWTYDVSMCFDGNRLALARGNRPEGFRYDSFCGMDLLILDRTGVLYAGTFESSLDRGKVPDTYEDRDISPAQVPIILNWNR